MIITGLFIYQLKPVCEINKRQKNNKTNLRIVISPVVLLTPFGLQCLLYTQMIQYARNNKINYVIH